MAGQRVYSRLAAPMHRQLKTSNKPCKAKVSLDRVSDFLLNTELLDTFTPRQTKLQTLPPPGFDEDAIGFNNASFAWSADSSSCSLTPSSRNFRLTVDKQVLFKPGCINMIVGPTYVRHFN